MIFDCNAIEAYDRAILALHQTPYEVQTIAEDVIRIGTAEPVLGLMATAHGEEPGGIFVLNELVDRIIRGEIKPEGSLLLAIGNRPAYERDVRYLERDLNRSYGVQQPKLLEEKRAAVLRDIFKDCDYVLDLHQTVEKTRFGYIIIPDVNSMWDYARQIAPGIPVVTLDFHKGVKTLTSFMASKGKMAATVEMGSGGMDPTQMEFAITIIERALGLLSGNATTGELGDVYHLIHHEGYSGGKVEFAQEFQNFDPIQEGDRIAKVSGQWVLAPKSGYLLLYPRKWFLPESHIEPEGLFAITDRG